MTSTEARGSAGGQVRAREVVEAGILAGIIGGLLMAMWAMVSAAVQGMSFLAPIKLIGATFVGPSALGGSVGILVWGLMLHLTVSAMWGILFASILRRETRGGTALLAGVAYGFVILLLMTWVVVPFTNQVMHDRIPMMWGSWIIEHVFFGVGVALAPYFRRQFSEGELRRRIPQPA
ncbi:MAG: hypothetical protein ACYCWW_14785 [Deltaproteobacteria bacterium]